MLRTYSRKPQECRYIEGVKGLCRLCLRRAEEAVPIFSEDTSDVCSSLALRVMICVGLEIKRDDSLPNKMCCTCYKDLEHYYAFRKKCEASYQRLRSHLQAARNRQAIEAINSASKEVDLSDEGIQDQDENVTELGLATGSEESFRITEVKPEPVINDVQNDISVKTKQTKVKSEEPYHAMEPEQLGSMLAAVLEKLGVLARAGPLLARARAQETRIQLETADGAVIRMELGEEDDVGDVPDTENELYIDAPANNEEKAEETSSSDAQVEAPRAKEEVKSKKSTGKGAGAGCGWCGLVFSSGSALRRHARTHSGERPFACPLCARTFAQKEVMHRHLLVHSDDRPHKCSTCPKSFTQRNALLLHERSHLPPHERPLALHSCPRCPKLFLYSSGLSRHMLTHSGRVFECGACRRQFADRSSVLRHVRRADHAPPAPTAPTAPVTPTAPPGDQ